ncbi:hypothetical protein EHO60_16820 [Leptospira fletcheri]|uniref:Uncharacterized protein n=1 Tax=Leptospira fletcheri TaxID=2484981 RepID=A0A4R9G667_9LEPT|nr:hypothetical protein [Leptospira fletcheri]TGK06247.1 hypothetical protein EHO60_16820 [Leptospira fletcheri]
MLGFRGKLVGALYFAALTISSAEVAGEPAANTYRGTIPLESPRSSDLKSALSEGNPNFPENIRLFFQGTEGNYAVFYDWNGHTFYYQYRENKFDRRLRKYVSRLSNGAAYEVSGEYVGVFVFENKVVRRFKKKGEDSLADKKERQSIPVFRLKAYKELIVEDILF